MKRTSALLIAIIVVASVTAFANSVPDPKIIVKDPVCGVPSCAPVGTHFTFTSPSSGTGTLFFSNTSGVTWTSLKLVESGVPASAISCTAPGAFAHCGVNTVNGITTILLTGVGGSFMGIPAWHNFSIQFVKWPKGGVSFTATANVPEPATVAILLTGLVGIGVRRRKLLRRS